MKNEQTAGPIDLSDSGAFMSPDKVHRYVLWRSDHTMRIGLGLKGLEPRGPVVFVMLNPSTADADHDDPTIRQCQGFARTWGYESLIVVNLFGWRSSSPDALTAALADGIDVVGEDNDLWIASAAMAASRIVVAWGARAVATRRSYKVCQTLNQIFGGQLWCLGTTANGQPRHPLFVKRSTEPVPWSVRH